MSRAFGMWLLLALAGQEAKPKAETEAIEGFKKQAGEYVFEVPAQPRLKPALVKTPLLHWGNPARTGEDGAVFVWVAEGRPVVIGSIFTYKLKEVKLKHELQSLSTEPLKATFRDQTAWTPEKAGVEFNPVPDAPLPSDSARLRITQMRQLARQFSARMTELDKTTTELRLMPNPLYRYELDGKGAVIDGAIFAFAQGTDPEVLLLLETHRTAEGGRRWEYAFARFHYVSLWAFHDGKEVWSVEEDPAQAGLRFGDAAHQNKTYTSYRIE